MRAGGVTGPQVYSFDRGIGTDEDVSKETAGLSSPAVVQGAFPRLRGCFPGRGTPNEEFRGCLLLFLDAPEVLPALFQGRTGLTTIGAESAAP